MIETLRAWLRGGDDPALQIVPPRQTFTGFDPALRERTAARRQREARIRQAANRVACSPETDDRRLRIVGQR